MGVTIHYQGQAADQRRRDEALEVVRAYAVERNWPLEELFPAQRERYAPGPGPDDDAVRETVETMGVSVVPHDLCEPFTLEFGPDFRFSSYTKTAFAPRIIHDEILALLERIRPLLLSLEVIDESAAAPPGETAQEDIPTLKKRPWWRLF